MKCYVYRFCLAYSYHNGLLDKKEEVRQQEGANINQPGLLGPISTSLDHEVYSSTLLGRMVNFKTRQPTPLTTKSREKRR